MSQNNQSPASSLYDLESNKLEIVTTCVGFDDILDVTLENNHNHADTYIVVTSHEDAKTHAVCRKYGATCVQTDLFKKNNRKFNKGAAINAGFNYFQWHGWRLHMDSDIVLPDNFRRILFNHSHLDRNCLYGIDRVNVIGSDGLDKLTSNTQHKHRKLEVGNVDHRWLDEYDGYLPLGFFQLYHSSCQKPYPFSLGDASHDDLMFSALWPKENRRHLPSIVAYHLLTEPTHVGQNWEGRKTKRLK